MSPVGVRSICNVPLPPDDIYDLGLMLYTPQSRILFPRTGIFCDESHEWLIWAHRYQSGWPAEWVWRRRNRGEATGSTCTRAPTRRSSYREGELDSCTDILYWCHCVISSGIESCTEKSLRDSVSSDHNDSSKDGNSVRAGMW
jgi:hypothetical protein